MGGVFSAVASCVGSCLSACLAYAGCKALDSCSPSSPSSRVPYSLFMFTNIILAMVLNFWGTSSLENIFGADMAACKGDPKCLGNQALFRISFSLFCFFLLHALFSLTRATMSFHHRFWLLKLLGFSGLLIGCFFIDNKMFDVYADISRIVSIVFLIAQVVILLDVAYSWNISWVEKDKKSYLMLILFVSLAGFVTSYVMSGFFFDWFNNHPTSSCGLQKTVISLNIVFSVIYSIIAVSKWCEHGAFLPSSVVFVYCTWLVYSALASDPSLCNLRSFSGNDKTSAQLWIGLAMMATSITYAGYSISSNAHHIYSSERKNSSADSLVNEGSDVQMEEGEANASGGGDSSAPVDEDELDDIRKRNLVFHLVMCGGSMYMAMLLSNWGYSSTSYNDHFDQSKQSMWVKIATGWLTIILYLWTLVAPYLLPDRDFS